MRKARALLLAAAGLLIALATPAAAQQDYPNRPIRLIIPFPAGGSNDIVGRAIAQQMGDRLGKQVIVDNRTGAGGVIGTELAAHAPPDGYTILVISHRALGQSVAVQAALRPDQGVRADRHHGHRHQCADGASEPAGAIR